MDKPRIAALMIGRGGSTLQDKNILPVFDVPLLHYTAAAAKRSKHISSFYVSSDCPKILAAAGSAGYKQIVRPPELSQPTSQSVDVVNHALHIIEADETVDILVVQHANVGTITAAQIDDCINKLIDNPELSSVIPVHEKSEYHPYRARTITRDGLMIPFFDFSNMTVSGNRQDLPTCYFFDHSIWVLSVEKGIKSNGGQPPWTCMGDKLLPYVTHGCFDVHDLDDLKRTEAWILENKVPIPKFINGELF